jgi:hypothetical protein
MPSWELFAKLGVGAALRLLRKQLDDRKVLEGRYPAIKDFADLNVLIVDSPQMQADAAALVATTAFGLAKKKGVLVQGAMSGLPPWHKKVIRTMKRHLDKRSVAAIVSAYTLMRLEDLMGRGGVTPREVSDKRTALFRRDERFRRRVYNDCRSGYMLDILYEYALDVESEGLPIDDASAKVQEAFNRVIESNPLNIYVNDRMGEEDLFLALNKLLNAGRELIRVYARGDAWLKVQGWTREFAVAQDLKFHVQDEPIGRTRAGCCRVWRTERFQDWAPLERDLEATLREEAPGADKPSPGRA